ncbi:MAG: porin family protein [Proteobacteria bacterium]|nr:porin family protein [Pseudomonadota bacterium]
MRNENLLKEAIAALGLIAFMGLSAVHARAADDSKWYMGASLGNTNVDTGIRGLTATKDEDDSGYKFFAGYNFSKFIGVEFYYADLGEESLKGNTGDLYKEDGYTYAFIVDNAALTWETVSYGYDLVFYAPLSHFTDNDFVGRFTPFLKYGGHFWDTELTARGNGVRTTHSYDDDYYSAAGIGFNVDITVYIALRAEYERAKIDNDQGDYVSAGVFVQF